MSNPATRVEPRRAQTLGPQYNGPSTSEGGLSASRSLRHPPNHTGTLDAPPLPYQQGQQAYPAYTMQQDDQLAGSMDGMRLNDGSTAAAARYPSYNQQPLARNPSSLSNHSGYRSSGASQHGQGAGAAASVYSLDSASGGGGGGGGYAGGMEPVYEQGSNHNNTLPGRRRSSGQSYEEGSTPGSMGMGMSSRGFTPMENHPYMNAASDYLGLAPPPPPPPPPSLPPPASAGASRTNTLRSVSSASEISLKRTPTTSIGSSKAKRQGISAAIDVTKPPYTREFVDDYRARMKLDPDPEAQFAFVKYLIEAARKIGDDMSVTDPRAGKKYRDGLLAESLKVLKKLAAEGGAGKGEGGYPEAQFFLANMFGTGQLGLQVDHEKAYQLYMQASKANHPAATYRTAVCNELGAGTRKELNRAILFYRKAATLRDTAAMYKLAMSLITGTMGQQVNPREGITWLRRAASQADEDNPHALHELAMVYEDPRPLGIPPSILAPSLEAAREHYTQAAFLGYAPSMHKLGQAYESGHLRCPIDPRRSIAWTSRAAEKGDAEASLALSGWFLTGAEGILKQDDQEAFLWARRAAEKGLPKAEFALGHYIEAGIGVPRNFEVAKNWYLRAAKNGSEQARNRLDEIARRKRATGRPTRQEAKAEGCVIA